MTAARQAQNKGGGHPPRIWIVSTGTEILQGHYPDTNAQWLSRELLAMGFEIERHMALPDRHDVLAEELAMAAGKCDLIIMTGGLGPTADDMNRVSVAKVFQTKLIEDKRALDEIRERFARRHRPMPESNAVQAMIPEGAEVLYNRWGTAPGFYLHPKEGSGLQSSLLALPGPPREMRPMFEKLASSLILDQFGGERRERRTLTIHTVGLAESHINDRIKDLFGIDPRVNVALLAGKWRVDVRLTLQGESAQENQGLEEEWREIIYERLGEQNIFGEDRVELPEAVGMLLRERGQTLALAESCTGGLIAKQMTDAPGSSDYFLEGFVTYANEAKTKRLNVTRELLEEQGAVSAPVAEAMARGAQQATGADWALSVTGIAGPAGGSEEKPVGLVFFGLAAPDGRLKHRRIMGLGGDRAAVREYSAVTGLNLLRRAILQSGAVDGGPEPPRSDA